MGMYPEKYMYKKKMGMHPKGKGYVFKAASKLSVRRTLTLQPGGSRRRS